MRVCEQAASSSASCEFVSKARVCQQVVKLSLAKLDVRDQFLPRTASTQAYGLVGKAGGGPVAWFGVDVGCDGDAGRGCGSDGCFPAVDDDLGVFSLVLTGCGVEGDGAGFVRNEREVIVAGEDWQDAFAGVGAAQLQMSHERDVCGGIVEGDGNDFVFTTDDAAREFGFERDGGQIVEDSSRSSGCSRQGDASRGLWR